VTEARRSARSSSSWTTRTGDAPGAVMAPAAAAGSVTRAR
jgi:hypothetical protein